MKVSFQSKSVQIANPIFHYNKIQQKIMNTFIMASSVQIFFNWFYSTLANKIGNGILRTFTNDFSKKDETSNDAWIKRSKRSFSWNEIIGILNNQFIIIMQQTIMN